MKKKCQHSLFVFWRFTLFRRKDFHYVLWAGLHLFFLLLLFESALRFSLHIVPTFRPAVCEPMTKSTISVPST